MLLRIKWTMARVIFIVCSFSTIFSLGLTGYILAPLFSWYFFNDLNIIKHRKWVYPIFFSFSKYLFRSILDSNYKEAFSIKLSSPPLLSPALYNLTLNKSWEGNYEDCNGCVKCCAKLGCVFLEKNNKNCLIYGSFFWRYFNCGRFPENEKQIKYYNCPKWEVVSI